jgi:tRNA A-37 threonylcarbamoyl transferase component Bud32
MNETIGPPIAVGNVAEVFELGARVAKIYKATTAKSAAFREAANHSAAEAIGLPVPRIWAVQQFGDRWGIVFDRVNHASFAEEMSSNPGETSVYLNYLAHLHMLIHAQRVHQFASFKQRLTANIAVSRFLPEQKKQNVLQRLIDMPEGDRLCHGDFHPMNVLGDVSQPFIIDWADARRGDPAADACRSYLLLKLHAAQLAAPYIDAYCQLARVPRQAVLDWLPYLAAAKLAEDVPSEIDGLLKIVGSPS